MQPVGRHSTSKFVDGYRPTSLARIMPTLAGKLTDCSAGSECQKLLRELAHSISVVPRSKANDPSIPVAMQTPTEMNDKSR